MSVGLEALIQFLRNLGTVRLIVMVAVLALLAGFFAYIMTRISSPSLILLYSELSPADASKIVAKLESLGVAHEIRNEGTAVFAQEDQVTRLRMRMAEDGLPGNGSVGYEVFDRSDALGVTSFMQDINQLRALEGELSRTISSLKPVAAARVHLVIPKKALFARDGQDASASVILKMRGSVRLVEDHIQAIQHLVATAVPGLSPTAISIVDDRGILLARGGTRIGINGLGGSTADEIVMTYENRLSRSVEEILEKSIGPGRVRAEVRADMDFDKKTETSELFDPDGQVIRSTQNSEDGSTSSENKGQDTLTVQNALPNANQQGANQASNNNKKSEETLNYEISKTVRSHVKEGASLKRLSVAVLIDGVYTKDKDGKEVYAPRTDAEMEKVTALVKSAIGYQKDRGDVVEVTNMRFAINDTIASMPPNELILGMTKSELIHMIEMLFLGLSGILVGLLVLKPLVWRLFEHVDHAQGVRRPTEKQSLIDQTLRAMQGIQSQNGPTQKGVDQVHLSQNPGAAGENDARFEVPQKESATQKIGEVINNHPDQAVSLVRSWIAEK